MAPAPLDSEEFDRWRIEARSALRAASSQVGLGLHNWACFLAEQASQLAVKGLLAGIGQPTWGHDLVRLGDEARSALEDGWPGRLDPALRRLSRHYITSRYPDAVPSGTPGGHYGPEDSEQALADAGAVLGAVDRAWADMSS
ncbi:MAG: HEPN domain-containing protein [Actinomycetota bacterium]|nr:HEPN domain-containing protein [Actinomycetota bacterium]